MRIIPLVVSAALAAAACGKQHGTTDAPGGDAELFDGGTSSPGIYVTNSNSTITVYAIDAVGDAAPLRTIAGQSTGLSLPIGIAVDHKDDIYIANRMGASITVYPSTADGDVAPKRTLTATGMMSPQGLALAADESLFASTCPGCGSSAGGDVGVYHFPVGADVSDRALTGASTGFTVPSSLTISADGELFVGNSFGGPIEAFSTDATGDVAPTRMFQAQGSNMQSMTHGPGAIAVAMPGAGLELYPFTATGAPAPSSTIGPSASLPLNYPGGVFIDTTVSPETIYLVDYGATAIYVITTAGTEPNLTVASVRTISGPTTALSGPLDIAIVR